MSVSKNNQTPEYHEFVDLKQFLEEPYATRLDAYECVKQDVEVQLKDLWKLLRLDEVERDKLN